ncbi:NlpC/P60 family protein [Corynebacterium sp. H128]|uniref:C40 family peptidase n=1 Tax=unclassified Corynebacterium TaxID=2624378 RepID=UPI003096F8AE
MKTSSIRGVVLASLIAGSSALLPLAAPVAFADPAVSTAPSVPEANDMDSLVKALDAASEQVSTKSEEFKQLQADVDAKEHRLGELRAQSKTATAAAEQARQEELLAKGVVDELAATKYRGALIDPITTVINSDGPQNAIDRSAYISSYLRRAQAALDEQRAKSAEAGRLHGEAARLEAEAEFQVSDLNHKKSELEAQDKELRGRIAEIEKRINELNPAERAAWERKNGPVKHSLAGITSTNAEGMKALEVAMTKIGAPYGWGAAGPDTFDCSGLVVWSYAQQGKSLPRTSQAQMAGGAPVDRAALQPGDVVGFYPGATHVGIYAGDGKIVHASDYGIPLQVVNMDSMPFYGARRY